MSASPDGAAASRRAVVVALGASVLFAPGFGSAVKAQTAARFRSVAVDTRPLASIGGAGPAALIQRLMPAKLAGVFHDLLVSNEARAPVLVARIDRLFLSSYSDVPSPGIDSFGTMDSMEGAGLVLAGRQQISVTPLRVTLPAGYSGASYLPDIDQRRIDSLCIQFASWLRREMSL